MVGEKCLHEIEQTVKEAFPAVINPKKEVLDIAKQLHESGFINCLTAK